MRDEPLHALALPLICAALLQHGSGDRRTFHLLPVSATRAVLPFSFVDADIVQDGCSFEYILLLLIQTFPAPEQAAVRVYLYKVLNPFCVACVIRDSERGQLFDVDHVCHSFGASIAPHDRICQVRVIPHN